MASYASGQDDPNRSLWFIGYPSGQDEAILPACSGLPAVSCKQNFPESHIINPLFTKFVRSRWRDIGLVLFCEFMDLDEKLAKKDEANIYSAILIEQT